MILLNGEEISERGNVIIISYLIIYSFKFLQEE